VDNLPQKKLDELRSFAASRMKQTVEHATIQGGGRIIMIGMHFLPVVKHYFKGLLK
jgi:hypothetical protein